MNKSAKVSTGKSIAVTGRCNGLCLDSMFAMISHIGKIDAGNKVVESRLVTGDQCKVGINIWTE